jgi:hypothetical protein
MSDNLQTGAHGPDAAIIIPHDTQTQRTGHRAAAIAERPPTDWRALARGNRGTSTRRALDAIHPRGCPEGSAPSAGAGTAVTVRSPLSLVPPEDGPVFGDTVEPLPIHYLLAGRPPAPADLHAAVTAANASGCALIAEPWDEPVDGQSRREGDPPPPPSIAVRFNAVRIPLAPP